MGIVNLILIPFIFIFMVINFFLKNAEEFHNKKYICWCVCGDSVTSFFVETPFVVAASFLKRRVRSERECKKNAGGDGLSVDMFMSFCIGAAEAF